MVTRKEFEIPLEEEMEPLNVGADRAWYLARMRKRLEDFDEIGAQILHLKIGYLTEMHQDLSDLVNLDATDPQYEAKRKSLRLKLIQANDAYSALRR